MFIVVRNKLISLIIRLNGTAIHAKSPLSISETKQFFLLHCIAILLFTKDITSSITNP